MHAPYQSKALLSPGLHKEKLPQNEDVWVFEDGPKPPNAVRQLSRTRKRGGRKHKSLPGVKLQPIFKNHSSPAIMQKGKFGIKQVLPHITTPPPDGTGLAMQQVIAGHTDNLPNLTPTHVRIYLCSDSKDMKEERTAIWNKAVPKLKQFCSSYGILFQLVDLNEGAEATQVSLSTRLQEIRDCQHLSLGPNFVLLLGCNARERPPAELSEEQYDSLMNTVMTENLNFSDLLLMSYFKDTNAEPPVYVLQNLDNKEDENNLTSLIKEILNSAVKVNAPPKNECSHQQLTLTDLAAEVQAGILSVREPRSSCLCFHREWKPEEGTPAPIKVRQPSPSSGRQSLSNSEVAAFADEIKAYLRDGYKEYYISGKDQDSKERYLNNLCEDFVQCVQQMIEAALKQQPQTEREKRNQCLHSEVLHHLRLAVKSSQFFCGHMEPLNKVKRYLQDPRQNTNPLLVYAESGQGKTTFMAALVEKLRDWFGGNIVVVYRCLGTSSESCNIKDVVQSMIDQITKAYNVKLQAQQNTGSSLYDVLLAFRELTDIVSKSHAFSKPLFMVLDGIDNLQPFEASLRALWAIKEFQPNVHLIISAQPVVGSLRFTDAFKRLVGSDSSKVELEELSSLDAKAVICKHMSRANRKISDAQLNRLTDIYSQVPKPLFLATLAQSAAQWRSYADTAKAYEDLPQCLTSIMEMLEDRHGMKTVKYMLSYITASVYNGIFEQELLDLLTLKQEVQEELAQNSNSEDHAFQSAMAQIGVTWAKVKKVISPFICEFRLYGKVGYTWSHIDIVDIVADRYAIIYPGIDESKIGDEATNFTLSLHQDFFNMYTSDNSILPAAVSPQPYTPQNLTKLNKMLLHGRLLIPVVGLTPLKTNVLFNFDWLMSKLKAGVGHEVIEDLYSVSTLVRHLAASDGLDTEETYEDLGVLFLVLLSCKEYLHSDPVLFPVVLYNKLIQSSLASGYPSMQKLVDALKEFIKTSKEPMLLSTYSCFPSVATGILGGITGPTHVIDILCEQSLAVFFRPLTGVYIYQSELMELQHVIPTSKEQTIPGILISSSREFLVLSHYSHVEHTSSLAVYNLHTGLPVLHEQFQYSFEAVALSNDDATLAVATTVNKQRCILAIDVKSKEIKFTLTADSGVHKDGVSTIKFLNIDGSSQILSVGSKRSKDIAIWDLQTEQLVSSIDLDCYAEFVECIQEDKLLCATADGAALILIDLKIEEVAHTMERQALAEGISDMYLAESEDYALVVTKGGVLKVNTAEFTDDEKFFEHSSRHSPTKIAVDRDLGKVFVGCADGSLLILSLEEGLVLGQIKLHTAAITSMVLDEMGLLHTASLDGTVKRLAPGMLVSSNKDTDDPCLSNQKGITQMAQRQNGQLVTASSDGHLRMWNLDGEGSLAKELALNISVKRALVAYKDRLLVCLCQSESSSRSLQLLLYNLETGQLVATEEPLYVFTCAVAPPEDKLLLVCPAEGNTATGVTIGILDLFDTKVTVCTTFSIYNHRTDWTNLDLLVMPPHPVDHEEDWANNILLLHQPEENISYFYTLCANDTYGNIQLFKEDPVHIDTKSIHATVAVSHQVAASGSVDGSLILWDVEKQAVNSVLGDPKVVKQLEEDQGKKNLVEKLAHKGPVSFVKASSDGKMLITAGTDGQIRVWDLSRQEANPVSVISNKNMDSVSVLELAGNNQWILCGSTSVLKVFSAFNGKELCHFNTEAELLDAFFSYDDHYIVCRVDHLQPRIIALEVLNIPLM